MHVQPAIRPAVASDVDALVELRAVMFADMGVEPDGPEWRSAARAWFARALDQRFVHIAVVEADDQLVACGMVELHAGAPSPMCPTGRTAHLSNLVTRREARGRGFGSLCMNYLIEWAEQHAERVELHASAHGLGMYERRGFVVTANPSMRLPLSQP